MAVAILTGASKGLGRALAAGLLEQGWSVVIDARHGDALATSAADLVERAESGRLEVLAGDVTDEGHRAELVAAASALGGLDLLVNNASSLGPSPLGPLRDYPLAEFRAVYETNLVAPLALCQAALPLLGASSDPRIVNISSDAAVEAYEGWGGYGSSKAALDHLSAVLAAEEPAVRVFRLDPGDLRTEMHQLAFPGQDISDRPEPESVVPAILDLVESDAPSGRYRAVDLAVDRARR